MNYPWYSWLSIFGFFIEFIRGAYKILIQTRPLQLSKWITYVGKVLGLLFGLLILPTALLLFLMNYLASVQKVLGGIINLIIWIYVYIIGVYIARKLYSYS